MPRPNSLAPSKRFNQFTAAVKVDNHPSFTILNDDLANRVREARNDFPALYQDLEGILLEVGDSQYGIVTKVMDKSNESRTGRLIIRDATRAIPLEERISPDSLLIESNNILLRTLGTLRGIDHAFSTPEYETFRPMLKKLYENLLVEMIEIQKKLKILAEKVDSDELKISAQLMTLERDFNADLALVLNASGFTNAEDAETYKKLLIHFRYLAALIDPAPTIKTIVYDAENDMLLTDTSYPITIKTPAQLNSLIHMKTVLTEPGEDEKNYQTVQPLAIQRANAAFYNLAIMDDRRFPAQMRKVIPATVKNGYFVCNTVTSLTSTPQKSFSEWSARSAALVYMGKGEKDDTITRETENNIDQLQTNLTELQKFTGNVALSQAEVFHLGVLNTDSPIANQSLIVGETEKVATKMGQWYSYLPTNIDGTNRMMAVSSKLLEAIDRKGLIAEGKESRLSIDFSTLPKAFDKKGRLKQVAGVGLVASAVKGVINLFTCASGQDRTGTAIEATTGHLIASIYSSIFNKKVQVVDIQKVRALGVNAAFIASAAVPGSPGMKHDSEPGEFFPKEVKQHLYLDSASTNKKAYLNVNKFKKGLDEKAEIGKISHKGEDILNRFDRFLKGMDRRNRWYLFLSSGKLKREIIKSLRADLEKRLEEKYDPQELLNAIEKWEAEAVRPVNRKGYQEYPTNLVIIRRHRNIFFDEIREDQEKDPSQRTTTQKFIEGLKEDLRTEIKLAGNKEEILKH